MDVIRRKLFDTSTRRKLFASLRKILAFAGNISHLEGRIKHWQRSLFLAHFFFDAAGVLDIG